MRGKKLQEKKLEIFKSITDDLKVSKNGNFYHVLQSETTFHRIIKSAVSITKNTIDKIGQEVEWKTENKTILLYNGKEMKIKYCSKKNFQKVNIGTLKNSNGTNLLGRYYRKRIARLFFFNKKCEWLWQYPQYYKFYSIARSFKSLKELKIFLGFKFLSDKDFVTKVRMQLAIEAYSLVKDKSTIVGKEYGQTTMDTISMLREDNTVVERFPKDITVLHDELVMKLKFKKADETVYYFKFYDNFVKALNKLNVKYKILVSQRDLQIESHIMSHCVGTSGYYFDRLKKGTYVYIHIEYEGNSYTAEIKKNGFIQQIAGRFNSRIGVDKLKDLLSSTGQFFRKLPVRENRLDLLREYADIDMAEMREVTELENFDLEAENNILNVF